MSSLVGDCLIIIEIIQLNGQNWWVYRPNNASQKILFWDKMASLSSICGNVWCILGDFNVIRSLEENFNSNSFTRSMMMFNDLISELELVDPPLANAQFTWSNFCKESVCCRLDRFLFLVGLGDLFYFGRQEAVIKTILDHCPITFNTNPPNWGPMPFTFENMWLDHKDLQYSFKLWWSDVRVLGWEGFKFMSKFRALKVFLKRWNDEVFNDLRWKRKTLMRRLENRDKLESTTN